MGQFEGSLGKVHSNSLWLVKGQFRDCFIDGLGTVLEHREGHLRTVSCAIWGSLVKVWGEFVVGVGVVWNRSV